MAHRAGYDVEHARSRPGSVCAILSGESSTRAVRVAVRLADRLALRRARSCVDAADAGPLRGLTDVAGLAVMRVAIAWLTGIAIGLGVGLGANVSPIVAVCGAIVLGALLAAIIVSQQRRP